MSDIFINTETNKPPKPGHGNNCHGHFTSISAGGHGHYYNDGCGCEELSPETSIDFILPLLILSALMIIIKRKLIIKTSHL